MRQAFDGNKPIVLRTWAKPPKEYKYGTDFRTYVQRLELYANLNNIPQAQRASLLLTLLDSHAFDIAQNLTERERSDYRRLVHQLTQKFDFPAGELGNQIRLNNRPQLINESLIDYLDALSQLAQRTQLDAATQHTKIIESMMENANDPKVRQKILKFVAQAHEEAWDQDRLWHHFVNKIKQLEKMKTLATCTKMVNPSSQLCQAQIEELTEQVHALMSGKIKTDANKDNANFGSIRSNQPTATLNTYSNRPFPQPANNQNYRNQTQNYQRNQNYRSPYPTMRPNTYQQAPQYPSYRSPQQYTPRGSYQRYPYYQHSNRNIRPQYLAPTSYYTAPQYQYPNRFPNTQARPFYPKNAPGGAGQFQKPSSAQ